MTAKNLFSALMVRERCLNICNAVDAGESEHFRIDRRRIAEAAELTRQVMTKRYPDGVVPYHSRWRHFEAGGIARAGILNERLRQVYGKPSSSEIAGAQIDLTVISVLLDAGAGAQWQYKEASSGQRFTRSEGLGVASFNAFINGEFSSDPDQPLRVDGPGLKQVTPDALVRMFQADNANPLVGLEQRATLLNRLGDALLAEPDRFGTSARPGELFNQLTKNGQRTSIDANELLRHLLSGLADVWMTGNTLSGVALGDTWQHRLAGGDGISGGWVPFHKLTQWLTYSLLEPFEAAGVSVNGVNKLTALPEYRNGGLLIDTGVIHPIDPGLLKQPLRVSDEAVIEWRALTVALIDNVADALRTLVGADTAELSLARILEGGTWAAGRELAARRRGGLPPLNIVTDGTVF